MRSVIHRVASGLVVLMLVMVTAGTSHGQLKAGQLAPLFCAHGYSGYKL